MSRSSLRCLFYAWRAKRNDNVYWCIRDKCNAQNACQKLYAVGLDTEARPLKRAQRPFCGARNSQGKPCNVRVEGGKRRCRFHGGKSTGPKTQEGRDRISAAQRKRWKKYHDNRILKSKFSLKMKLAFTRKYQPSK